MDKIESEAHRIFLTVSALSGDARVIAVRHACEGNADLQAAVERLLASAVHGDSFRDAGFALTIQGLTPGTYDLAVFLWSNVTGAFAPPKVVRVTIK